MEEKLAKITEASLMIKEHGILNFWIYVEYEEGCHQGIGGIILDEYDEEKETRIGTAFGCEVIRRLLLALGVNDFAEMEGKLIWVLGDGKGLGFKPKGIRKLNVVGEGKPEPVIFDDILAEFN